MEKVTVDKRSSGLAIVPIALLLHAIEEGLAFRVTLPHLQIAASRLLGRAIQLPLVYQCYAALAIITLAGFALLLMAARWDRTSYALVVVQAVMTLNVVAHIIGAVLLRGYIAGIVTALLVELPTSVLVYRRLRKSQWMTRSNWALLPLWAVGLHGPGLLGLIAVVRGI
jgi:hypothetical protein